MPKSIAHGSINVILKLEIYMFKEIINAEILIFMKKLGFGII